MTAPIGFYLSTSWLRDLKLPRSATVADLGRALKALENKQVKT